MRDDATLRDRRGRPPSPSPTRTAAGDPERSSRPRCRRSSTRSTPPPAHTIPDGTDAQTERDRRGARHRRRQRRSRRRGAERRPSSSGARCSTTGSATCTARCTARYRAAGTPFIVGGAPLLYPGQPVGPPEVWINCRCTLAAAVADWRRTCEPTELVAASDKPWSHFSASDYTIEQWRQACLLKMPGGDPESKSTYKLPVREPGGALNRNGVHAAAAALAGARGGVKAPAEAKAAAKAQAARPVPAARRGPTRLVADAVDRPTRRADGRRSAWPKTTSPPGTHDAPGWLTNPQETQRLRTLLDQGAGRGEDRLGLPRRPHPLRQVPRQVRRPRARAGAPARTCTRRRSATGNPESRGRTRRRRPRRDHRRHRPPPSPRPPNWRTTWTDDAGPTARVVRRPRLRRARPR